MTCVLGFYTNPTDYSKTFLNTFFISCSGRFFFYSNRTMYKDSIDPIRIITEKKKLILQSECLALILYRFSNSMRLSFQFTFIVPFLYVIVGLKYIYILLSYTKTQPHFNMMWSIIVLNCLCVCMIQWFHMRNL